MSGKATIFEIQREIGARMGRGDLPGAAAAAAALRAAWPADPAGWLLGSIAALVAEDKTTALVLIDARLAVDPDDVQCLLQKAECLLALGERAQSVAVAAHAAAGAADLLSLDAVGEFFFHAGEYRRARDSYDRAVSLTPRNPLILAKRADLHRVLGDFERAAIDYQAVLALSPGSAKALKGLVELKRQSTEQNSVAALERALAVAPADSTDAAILHFGLAKSFEDMQDHDSSWRHLRAANRIERARLDYRPAADREFIDEVIAEFPAVEVAGVDGGERPIFIVGIPRTGTTLIERILGGHSAVHSAGEITAMPDAIETVGRRTGAALGRLDGQLIAAEYLSLSKDLRGAKPRFTDKLLTNFFHCALLLRAFPAAHIVHVMRHPLAACFAIYRTRFNGTYPFAYDLSEIGAFYVGYRRLMTHWQQVLPGRILDVSYEDTITNLESTTRRLLAHLGLPFEAACLEFHRNAAPVKTTSSVQVRQPLYDYSLHAWRHYAAELEPLRAQLAAAGIEFTA